jgi:hypothetical protein
MSTASETALAGELTAEAILRLGLHDRSQGPAHLRRGLRTRCKELGILAEGTTVETAQQKKELGPSSSTRAVSACMEGGTRACGIAADRWWYRRGGGSSAPRSLRCGVVWPGVRTWQEIIHCHSRSISKGAPDARCQMPDACIRAARAPGSADRFY